MFREQYKGAYNEIKGDHTQIDKIFAVAQQPPHRKRFVTYRAATAFAAVLVVALSLYSYPELLNFTEPENTSSKVVDLSTYEYPKLNNATLSSPTEEKDTILQSDTGASDIPHASVTEKNTKPTSESSADTSIDTTEGNDIQIFDTASSDNTNVAVAQDEQSVTNDLSEPVLPKTTQENTTPHSYSGGGSSNYTDALQESTAAVTANTDPLVLNTRTLEYESGKTATITAYSQNETAASILNAYPKTTIGQYEVVITPSDTEQNFTVYAKNNDIYYIINSYGLSEQELRDLILTSLSD